MEGKYAREYALTCNPSDRWMFRGMEHGVSTSTQRIWVRKVELGDIITSRGKIVRWKIVKDNKTGHLYLGFIETIDRFSGYRHHKSSIYVLKLDARENTQRFKLYRIKDGNLNNLVLK